MPAAGAHGRDARRPPPAPAPGDCALAGLRAPRAADPAASRAAPAVAGRPEILAPMPRARPRPWLPLLLPTPAPPALASVVAAPALASSCSGSEAPASPERGWLGLGLRELRAGEVDVLRRAPPVGHGPQQTVLAPCLALLHDTALLCST